MKIYPVDKFLGDHINSALAFVAKTQSACLFGNDIRELIEAYKPSEKIAFHAKQLSSDLRVARQQCIENNTPKEIERLCGWVARRIVRSGFELTIKKNQDAVYTRDLIPCYRYFSFHFPQHSADMWRTVQLAINPTNDKYELLYLIDHFGSQLVRMVTLHLFA